MEILKFFFGTPYRFMLSALIFLCIYFTFFEMDIIQDWIDDTLAPFKAFGQKAPEYIMFGLVAFGISALFRKK